MARSRIKRGTIDWSLVHEDDIAILAHFGDREALSILWQQSIDQCTRVTRLVARRYPWIDLDDMLQEVISDFPKYVRRYDPKKAKGGWNKYLYHVFYRSTQDALRREDPLGIDFPHKKHYPFFRRFSEIESSVNRDITDEINEGVARLRRGDPANLDPDAPLSVGRKRCRGGRDPRRADITYHGPCGPRAQDQ